MQSVSSIIAPIISGFAGPVSARIQQRLLAAFRPVHLEIHNESHNHAAGQESHFKVVVVSPEFSGKNLIDRHRAINSALSEEFTAGLHALSIAKAATPEQWSQSHNVHQSPACLGGAKFERALAEARAAQQQ